MVSNPALYIVVVSLSWSAVEYVKIKHKFERTFPGISPLVNLLYRNIFWRRLNLTIVIEYNSMMFLKVSCYLLLLIWILTRSVKIFCPHPFYEGHGFSSSTFYYILFQIRQRELTWHQSIQRWSLDDNDYNWQWSRCDDYNLHMLLMRFLWSAQVVERLKAEVLAALNSTFTEADWPKGTKRGECYVIYNDSIFCQGWSLWFNQLC